MLAIYKSAKDAVARGVGTDYSIRNFITKDESENLSVAVSTLNGTHPGAVISNSDRAYYFLEADAVFEFDGEKVKVEADSVLFIPKDTEYHFTGTFKAVLINTPAFGVVKEKSGV